MGLLDEMAGKFMGQGTDATSNESSGLASGVMELLSNHPGGLSGLVQSFHANGVGDIVNSWISNGSNLPISADQIQSVLGSEQVQQLAGKLGISPDVASSKLAEILPGLVDKLTPDGKVAEGGSLLQQGLAFLGQKAS